MSRKDPKYHKLHKDLAKLQLPSERFLEIPKPSGIESEIMAVWVASSLSDTSHRNSWNVLQRKLHVFAVFPGLDL